MMRPAALWCACKSRPSHIQPLHLGRSHGAVPRDQRLEIQPLHPAPTTTTSSSWPTASMPPLLPGPPVPAPAAAVPALAAVVAAIPAPLPAPAALPAAVAVTVAVVVMTPLSASAAAAPPLPAPAPAPLPAAAPAPLPAAAAPPRRLCTLVLSQPLLPPLPLLIVQPPRQRRRAFWLLCLLLALELAQAALHRLGRIAVILGGAPLVLRAVMLQLEASWLSGGRSACACSATPSPARTWAQCPRRRARRHVTCRPRSPPNRRRLRAITSSSSLSAQPCSSLGAPLPANPMPCTQCSAGGGAIGTSLRIGSWTNWRLLEPAPHPASEHHCECSTHLLEACTGIHRRKFRILRAVVQREGGLVRAHGRPVPARRHASLGKAMAPATWNRPARARAAPP